MMDWAFVAVIVLVVGAVLVTVVYFAASRIDRLHRRVDRSWDALTLQLTKRASVAERLALAQIWDPVTSIVVSSAALAALDAAPDSTQQSELSAVLRQAMDDPDELQRELADSETAELLGELWQAWYRAQLARRFYNEAVAMTMRLRSRRAARLFHLAGRVPMPKSCDIDDAAPPGLEQLGPTPS